MNLETLGKDLIESVEIDALLLTLTNTDEKTRTDIAMKHFYMANGSINFLLGIYKEDSKPESQQVAKENLETLLEVIKEGLGK